MFLTNYCAKSSHFKEMLPCAVSAYETHKNASHLLSHKIPHIPIKRYNQSEIHFYQVFLLIRKICSSCDRNSLPLSERNIKCFTTPQSKSAILPAPLKRGALLHTSLYLKAPLLRGIRKKDTRRCPQFCTLHFAFNYASLAAFSLAILFSVTSFVTSSINSP